MKELEKLRDMLCDELKKFGSKGELSAGSLSTIDTMAHALKNLDRVLDDEDGYSGDYPYHSWRGSYARGRRTRDSMGRYSGEYGYSRNDLADKMRDLMHEAPDERTRQDLQRMVEKLENA